MTGALTLRNTLQKADFAMFAGVSDAVVAQATRKSRPLYPAVVLIDGKARINPAHPAAVAYLDRQIAKPKRAPAGVSGLDTDGLPDDVAEFKQWTLQDIVAEFGTAARFKDHLAAYKNIASSKKIEAEVAIKEGRFVDRDEIDRKLWTPMETLHSRLLGDTARTLSRLVLDEAKAEATPESIELLIHGRIAKELTAFRRAVGDLLSGDAAEAETA